MPGCILGFKFHNDAYLSPIPFPEVTILPYVLCNNLSACRKYPRNDCFYVLQKFVCIRDVCLLYPVNLSHKAKEKLREYRILAVRAVRKVKQMPQRLLVLLEPGKDLDIYVELWLNLFKNFFSLSLKSIYRTLGNIYL